MTGPSSTKHLEMLQEAIARMGGYSFVAKGWSVTLSIATFGLATKGAELRLLWIGALSVVMFWMIDAYYLGLERGFRALFKDAAAKARSGTPETFDMALPRGLAPTFAAAIRPAVLMVHPPLLAAFGVAALLIR